MQQYKCSPCGRYQLIGLADWGACADLGWQTLLAEGLLFVLEVERKPPLLKAFGLERQSAKVVTW